MCVFTRVLLMLFNSPTLFFASLSILFYPCLFVFSFLSLFSQREYAWSRKSGEEVDRVWEEKQEGIMVRIYCIETALHSDKNKNKKTSPQRPPN